MIRKAVIPLIASLVLVVGASPAHAVVAAAGPGGFAAGFLTPVVVTQSGGPVTFVNGDVTTHTLTADKYLPKKVAKKTKRCRRYSRTSCPLFTSGTVGAGDSGEVTGLRRVKSGKEYAFRCEIHSNMRGTLVVAPTS